MFVRDNTNSPREISKIFVRNALGNPAEISKIYVRNANGEPVLVFDNSGTVVPNLCDLCNTGFVYYYTVGGANTDQNISIPYLTKAKISLVPVCASGLPSVPDGIPTTLNTNIPALELNKTYWSKVGTFYPIAKTNPNSIETTGTYYTTLTQNLPTNCGTCFCNWLEQPFTTVAAAESVPFYYFNKLKTAYDQVTNYPPIPGYIVMDYTTYYVRDSFISSIKKGFLQGKWDTHGQTIQRTDLTWLSDTAYDSVAFPLVPQGAYDQSIAPSQTAETRASSIYPIYNRTVLFEYSRPPLVSSPTETMKNLLLTKCGQDYCYKVLGDFFFDYGLSTCQDAESIFGGGSEICCGNLNPPPVGTSPEECSGEISIDVQYPCTTDSPDPYGSGSCAIKDCIDLYDWNPEVGQPVVPPMPILLQRFNTGTGRTQPIILSDAIVEDCCSSCHYGPIASDLPTDRLDMCREIYQIPAINSELPHSSRLDFFDISTKFAMAIDGTTSGSKMFIRFILPAYATLHSSLKGKVIKMSQNSNSLMQFIQSGPSDSTLDGGSLSAENLSVYKALSGFFGFNLVSGVDLYQKDRIYLSTNAFYYEENRFSSASVGSNDGIDTSSYIQPGIVSNFIDNNTSIFVLKGISSSTTASSLGQYPLIWWSFNGYPNEEHSHYIVMEVEIGQSSKCFAEVGGNKTILRNNLALLIEKIKTISFYPLHFGCANLHNITATDDATNTQVPVTSYFRHPIFENYILHSSLRTAVNIVNGSYLNYDVDQGYPEPTVREFRGGNGFLDFYSNNLNTITTDQGGSTAGAWNTSTSPLQTNALDIAKYLIFRGPKSTTNSVARAYYSCLRLPPIKTYENFLNKYYPEKISL